MVTEIDLTNFTYAFWACAGISVLAVLTPAAVRRYKKSRFRPPFFFYVAILLTVAGGTAYRIWWIVARYLRNTGADYQWMVHHPFVAFVGFIVSLGLLMHVFNISKNRVRSTVLSVLFSTLTAFAVTWWLR